MTVIHQTAPIAFSGSPIDRADHLRSDPAAIAALRDKGGRLLCLDGLDPVLDGNGSLVWSVAAEFPEQAELIFLGLDTGNDNAACFAVVPPELRGSSATGPASWNAMAVLTAEDLATYGMARALVSWHARHQFCAVCGHSSQIVKGGWQRTCLNDDCRAEHFPRVDPVTIMLVEHEGRVLLGRQPRFPAGRYSALAGFVEAGETIEEAVAREVFEEAGVRVRDVTYVVSQPWPFPSSLMIGCHAHASDPAITIDRTELEDARWFTLAEVVDALGASSKGESGRAFGAPPSTAVAHTLLRWWSDRQAAVPEVC
ncbi:NAD(+) diphosphatase [Novosphingobium sp. M1R2S20]|uniref:NAD(+) diphosphatase n=1 Tax=Novosphingobium rhizovicinum TaxID=3228928 RepID=A0ABV3RB71_9SPHN